MSKNQISRAFTNIQNYNSTFSYKSRKIEKTNIGIHEILHIYIGSWSFCTFSSHIDSILAIEFTLKVFVKIIPMMLF